MSLNSEITQAGLRHISTRNSNDGGPEKEAGYSASRHVARITVTFSFITSNFFSYSQKTSVLSWYLKGASCLALFSPFVIIKATVNLCLINDGANTRYHRNQWYQLLTTGKISLTHVNVEKTFYVH